MGMSEEEALALMKRVVAAIESGQGLTEAEVEIDFALKQKLYEDMPKIGYQLAKVLRVIITNFNPEGVSNDKHILLAYRDFIDAARILNDMMAYWYENHSTVKARDISEQDREAYSNHLKGEQ